MSSAKDPEEQVLVDYLILVRALVANLRKEMMKTQLDRNSVKKLLLDFERSVRRVFAQNLTALFAFYKKSQTPNTTPPAAGQKQSRTSAIWNLIMPRQNSSKNLLRMLNHPEKFDDLKLHASLERHVHSMEVLVDLFEQIFPGEMMSTNSLLRELVATSPGGVDENWIVTLCYLCSMEVLVNKRFRAMNLGDPQKVEFKKRFKMLAEALKKEGSTMSELDSVLPFAFWDLRNKITHEGYCPNQDEKKQVIELSRRVYGQLRT